MIEERGAKHSGGQRQCIAIARALAINPRKLHSRRGHAALDYESERIIQRNMRRIVRGRTVIIIAHRLAALRGCYRIVGMARGASSKWLHACRARLRRPGESLRLSLGPCKATAAEYRR